MPLPISPQNRLNVVTVRGDDIVVGRFTERLALAFRVTFQQRLQTTSLLAFLLQATTSQ